MKAEWELHNFMSDSKNRENMLLDEKLTLMNSIEELEYQMN